MDIHWEDWFGLKVLFSRFRAEGFIGLLWLRVWGLDRGETWDLYQGGKGGS